MTDVQGRVADGFEPVVEAFEAALNAETGVLGAGGAALGVVVAGETVVDLWGGTADAVDAADPRGRPWTATTRPVIFSSTKGLVALCVAHLVDAGSLDYDTPVARYWPEFAQQDKESLTVRQLLGHRAGLPVIDPVLSREEVLGWSGVVEALAAQRPLWAPGTAWLYHPITYGWLGGELIRRVSGRLPGDYLREVFTGPAGVRTAIGVPEAEQGDIATIIPAPSDPAAPPVPPEDLGLRAINMNGALTFPGTGDPQSWNDPDVLAAQVPGANGVSSALDLAKVYAAAVGDGSHPGIISDAALQNAAIPVSWGPDWLGQEPSPTRAAGFQVGSAVDPMFGATSFGHGGAGGQSAFGDIRRRAGFAFLTNRMGGETDTRGDDLAAAVLRCLS